MVNADLHSDLSPWRGPGAGAAPAPGHHDGLQQGEGHGQRAAATPGVAAACFGLVVLLTDRLGAEADRQGICI